MERNVRNPSEYSCQNDKTLSPGSKPARRVGLMGGTFNPVHYGHLVLAEMAKSEAGLNEVWFLPSKNPPHKREQDILKENIRRKLLELSIKDNPDFSICDEELKREGISYTFETLLSLRKSYPLTEFCFIIGADSLFEFESWKNPGIILENAVLIAGSRNLAGKEKMEGKISSIKSRYKCLGIKLISMPEFSISSSEIRERIKEGRDIRYLLPKEAWEYILKENLYR